MFYLKHVKCSPGEKGGDSRLSS